MNDVQFLDHAMLCIVIGTLSRHSQNDELNKINEDTCEQLPHEIRRLENAMRGKDDTTVEKDQQIEDLIQKLHTMEKSLLDQQCEYLFNKELSRATKLRELESLSKKTDFTLELMKMLREDCQDADDAEKSTSLPLTSMCCSCLQCISLEALLLAPEEI